MVRGSPDAVRTLAAPVFQSIALIAAMEGRKDPVQFATAIAIIVPSVKAAIRQSRRSPSEIRSVPLLRYRAK